MKSWADDESNFMFLCFFIIRVVPNSTQLHVDGNGNNRAYTNNNQHSSNTISGPVFPVIHSHNHVCFYWVGKMCCKLQTKNDAHWLSSLVWREYNQKLKGVYWKEVCNVFLWFGKDYCINLIDDKKTRVSSTFSWCPWGMNHI